MFSICNVHVKKILHNQIIYKLFAFDLVSIFARGISDFVNLI